LTRKSCIEAIDQALLAERLTQEPKRSGFQCPLLVRSPNGIEPVVLFTSPTDQSSSTIEIIGIFDEYSASHAAIREPMQRHQLIAIVAGAAHRSQSQ
jgi:hypothetical protein